MRLYDIGSKSNPPAMSFENAHTSSITALGFQKDVRFVLLWAGVEVWVWMGVGVIDL